MSEIGSLIGGRYRIVRELGTGGFGRTYLAHDETAARQVAIKLLDPRGNADWKARELFEREAKVLGQLRHHGVPEMFELLRDEWDGAPAEFLVMQYIDGVSLQQKIEQGGAIDSALSFNLFLELLGILEYLHSRLPPVLHRDIKPANIVITADGLPTLVDFGSVRHLFQGPDEAGSTIAGTYGYMPYEQYMGQATVRSDLYALAATFLHLLTGRAPREFMTDDGSIAVPPSLPGDPRLPPVIARMLRPSPPERFGSAREVRDALLALDAASVAVVPAPRPTPKSMNLSSKDALHRASPTAFEYMDPDAKPGDTASLFDWGALVFVSLLTLGIYPAVFVAKARTRRNRVTPFLDHGIATRGTVLSIRIEKDAFDTRSARVSYQFTADGTVHRDSDVLLTSIADRLAVGDDIEVRYLVERGYDSIVIP